MAGKIFSSSSRTRPSARDLLEDSISAKPGPPRGSAEGNAIYRKVLPFKIGLAFGNIGSTARTGSRIRPESLRNDATAPDKGPFAPDVEDDRLPL